MVSIVLVLRSEEVQTLFRDVSVALSSCIWFPLVVQCPGNYGSGAHDLEFYAAV